MHRSIDSRGASLALILAAACWGTGTVVSKAAVAEFPPLTLLAIQLAASLVFLLTLMRLRGIPLRDRSIPPILGRLGMLNPGLAYALSLIGLVSISASLSVLLWALEPVLILLLARAVLGEPLGRGLLGLSAVAVGGMVLILNASGDGSSWLGVGLTLAGIGCCALYSVVTRRWLPGTDATAPVVAIQQLWALAFSVVVVGAVALTGGSVRPEGVSAQGWASALVSGVLYYAAAYWLYLSGLRRVPASVAASAFYLIPVFGVAGGGLVLGDRLSGIQWIGVAIVVGAVIAILRRHNPYASTALDPAPEAAPARAPM
jgi:drug/metabolite transporter (DMT)-like permease